MESFYALHDAAFPPTGIGPNNRSAPNGAFGSVEELDAVPGIGPARLEQLKELVDL
ncbi:MAG: hypothetical protein KY396_07555 [Actinobacteria bacterium]|nr:hypothetical protein [Actinomycetota bacterium]